jgi:calcium binding protein 39
MSYNILGRWRFTLGIPAQFFSSFTTLIMSSNYVTKRQSLKLLGEILLDRANFGACSGRVIRAASSR